MRALLLAVPLLAILGSPAPARAQHDGGDDVNAPARILGVDPDKEIVLTPSLKAYSEQIGDEVVCLCGTCPRFTVANCDCGWAAGAMRVIRAALVAGKSRDEIIAAYEKSYGSKAFPKPPGTLGDLTWLIPYGGGLLLLAALFAFGMRALRRTQASRPLASTSEPEDDVDGEEDRELLKRELEDLD